MKLMCMDFGNKNFVYGRILAFKKKFLQNCFYSKRNITTTEMFGCKFWRQTKVESDSPTSDPIQVMNVRSAKIGNMLAGSGPEAADFATPRSRPPRCPSPPSSVGPETQKRMMIIRLG